MKASAERWSEKTETARQVRRFLVIGVLSVLMDLDTPLLPETGIRAVVFLTATACTTVSNFLGMRSLTFRSGVAQRRRAGQTRAAGEPLTCEEKPA